MGGGVIGIEFFVEFYNVVLYLNEYGFGKLNCVSLKVVFVEVGFCLIFVLIEKVFVLVFLELCKVGVDVYLNIMIIEVVEDGLIIKDGEKIEVDLMVWVVGVKVLDFIKEFGFEINCLN